MRKGFSLVLALLVVSCAVAPDDAFVTGVVIAVDGNLTEVASFTIVTPDEEQLIFVPDPDGGNPGFPLVHLSDHIRSGDPVKVHFDERDETLWATWVDDATGGH